MRLPPGQRKFRVFFSMSLILLVSYHEPAWREAIAIILTQHGFKGGSYGRSSVESAPDRPFTRGQLDRLGTLHALFRTQRSPIEALVSLQ